MAGQFAAESVVSLLRNTHVNMYCANCGKIINETDNYCAICGIRIIERPNLEIKKDLEQVDVISSPPVTPQKQVISKKYTILLIIIVIALVGSFSAILFSELSGKRTNGMQLFALAFWIGIALAIYGKRKKSGLLWSFIVIIGIFGVVAFLIGFMRSFIRG